MIDWQAIRHRHRVACAALGIEPYELSRLGKFDELLRFARQYDVSLDWLVCGDGTNIRRHLAKTAGGTVVILPCMGPERRKWG